MTTYQYSFITNRDEIAAIRDMIFKRAQERSDKNFAAETNADINLNTGIDNSYKDSFRNEILDNARNSFVKANNPFPLNNKHDEEKLKEEISNHKIYEDIGFSQKNKRLHSKLEELQQNLEQKNKLINEALVNNARNSVMNDARGNLQNRKSFTGALDFLNMQASIKQGDKSIFDRLA